LSFLSLGQKCSSSAGRGQMKDKNKTKEQLINELKEMRRQGNELQMIFDLLPVNIWYKDDRERFVRVNNTLCKASGIPEEEWTGKTNYEVLSQTRMADLYHKQDQEVIKSGKPMLDKLLLFQNPKGDRWGLTSKIPAKDEKGQVTGIIGLRIDITKQKQEEEKLRHIAAELAFKAEEIRKSRRRIVQAQETLRKEIAQQLHGEVQNRLIVILHKLTQLENSTSSNNIGGDIRDLYEKVEELLNDHVRSISHQLFPSILRRGLITALQSLVDLYEPSLFVKTRFDEELIRREREKPKYIPESTKMAIYRIAEEALNNVSKHANGYRVLISLTLLSDKLLQLKVHDDGQGFNLQSTRGTLGLAIMEDYAKVLDGTCTINSSIGEGTEVTATVPLAELDKEHPGRTSPLE